jgi:hypothetical protein
MFSSGQNTNALVVFAKPDGRYGLIDGLYRQLVGMAGGCEQTNAYVIYPETPLTHEEIMEMRSALNHSATDGWHRIRQWFSDN